MPLFNDLSKKITATTQNVVRGTKDMTDTARLNSLIAEEQKQITGLYLKIGKLYYETNEADMDTQLGKLCFAINAANERIAKYEDGILQIKGVKRCPSCGVDIPINAVFCGGCGSKINNASEKNMAFEHKKTCGSCGAEVAENLAFCTSCGHKL